MPESTSVLFVCEHGSAKSVIAALHLRRLAKARGITLECHSAGLEPDPDLPLHVLAGLSADGLDASEMHPQLATRERVAKAGQVIALGCILSTIHERVVIQWDDIPAVSDGYETARDAILGRLKLLLDSAERR